MLQLTVKTVGELTLLPQVRAPLTIAQLPLDEVRVKPEPEVEPLVDGILAYSPAGEIPDAVPVNVAHVPVVYHVPALMIHPSAFPPVVTSRKPLPIKAPPPPVGLDPPPVVVVVGGVVPPDLGRYLIPVAGQSLVEPTIHHECQCQDILRLVAGRKHASWRSELYVPGSSGVKVPVDTGPATSKEYQISSKLLPEHWIVAETPRGVFNAALICADV